jgi:DNA helicase IV
VARALAALNNLVKNDNSFGRVRIDLRREFIESAKFDQYQNPEEGLAEQHLRRVIFHPQLPPKAISTVHKAKGLEKDNVMVVPCDQEHFGATEAKRRLLYVALSRATKSLAIVLPRNSCSPLFRI